jgi:T1SS-143 domain-containing protein
MGARHEVQGSAETAVFDAGKLSILIRQIALALEGMHQTVFGDTVSTLAWQNLNLSTPESDALPAPNESLIEALNSADDSALETIVLSLNDETRTAIADAFPALFGHQADQFPSALNIDFLAPEVLPVAGFDTFFVPQKPTISQPETQLASYSAATLSPMAVAGPPQVFNVLLATPHPPVATDDIATTSEDVPLNAINVLLNDSDADGDPLIVTSASAVNGTVTINPDNTLNYTPTPHFNGNDSISYSISDGLGGSDSATVSITVVPVNDPPQALNDSATTSEDTAITDIPVLTNDSDPDLDVLTVISASADHGTVSINANGTLDYLPDSNFNGTDLITYNISDGQGGTASATVTITVNATDDLNAADDSFVTNEDVAISNTVASNDSTTSGGTLSFSLNTDVTHGTLSLDSDGSFVYTPDLNYVGNDSFSYQVSDSETGETLIQNVAITVQPFSPLTAADDNFDLSEDTVLNGDVSLNDNTSSGGTLSFAVNSSTSFGSLVLDTDGSFSYTPDANYNGADSFTYIVSDPVSGDSVTKTVSLDVLPVADLSAADDSFTVAEDSLLSTTVSSNDSTTSGGMLSFSLDTDVSHGTLTFNADGSFNYQADSNYNGSDSFRYLVSDAASGESSLQDVDISITPVNDAPQLNNASAQLAEPDLIPTSTDSGSLSFVDADGDSQTMTLLAPSSALTSNGQTIIWTGANTDTLIGRADGTEILRITIDNNGQYQVMLSGPVDHPLAGSQDTLNFDITVQSTDGTATGFALLSISIEDDMPIVSDALTLFSISGASLSADGNALGDTGSYGQDGGFISKVTIGGYTYVYDADDNTVTQTGHSDLVSDYAFDDVSHVLTVNTFKGETLSVNLLSADYSYLAGNSNDLAAPADSDPEVSISDSGGLLNIVNADALGLIDLSAQQRLTASDADNDIEQLVVRADSLISLGVGSFYLLSYSTDMAAEFGLSVVSADDIASFLGITTQSYAALTITASDGGSIDNAQLNEFLATVFVEEFGLLNLGLTPTLTVSATDSRAVTVTDSDVDLLGLSLLGSNSTADGIQEGDANNNTIDGTADDDRLYGYNGDDTLNGLAGNDLLRGGAGTDVINGGDGNDLIIGGSGSDTLTGGDGSDVYRWQADDAGDDIITDFDNSSLASGGDILDFAGLLNGEGVLNTHPGNLTNYLHFSLSGADTLIYISTDGSFSGGFNLLDADQLVTLSNTDLVSGFNDDEAIIAALLQAGKLIVDEADSTTDMLAGSTRVDFEVVDNDGDFDNSAVIFDATGAAAPAPSTNSAPNVQLQDAALLGVIGLSALNLIDFSDQDLNAADIDGNLQQVSIQYNAFIGLGAYTVSASSAIAETLGLNIEINNDPGLLGLVNPSSTLTITALDGGTISNLAINELLATVTFNNGGSVIDSSLLTLNVLNATTLTATDDQGLTTSQNLASLTDINLLDSLSGTDSIISGTAADDSLDGSSGKDRLYGFDGTDTLSGQGGDDLLRGGAGDDQLSGNDGNDLVIGGSGNDTLQGGAGADVFRFESGDEGTTVTPAEDVITDFDQNAGDALDLSDLLIGESVDNLLDYLDFNFDGNDTSINVSVDGSGDVTQVITLQNSDITAAGTLNNQQIIDALLDSASLITD